MDRISVNLRLIPLFLLVVVVTSTITSEVYADTAKPINAFNLGWAFQDLQENFVGWFSSEAKRDLQIKHLAEIQMEVERLTMSKQQIPTEIEERAKQKTESLAKEIESTPIEKAINVVRNSQELTRIKVAVDQFHSIRDNCITDDNTDIALSCKPQVENLEDDVNKFNLVKENCRNQIDVKTLVLAQNPYLRLQTYCDGLKGVPESVAKSVLFGAE